MWQLIKKDKPHYEIHNCKMIYIHTCEYLLVGDRAFLNVANNIIK